MSAFQWTNRRPKEPGWYWFEVGSDSPPEMTRLARAIVLVTRDPINATKQLRVFFLQGKYYVADMGGRFAGPIPEPTESG